MVPYARKGWAKSELALRRPLPPATLHTWFHNTPYVQPLCCLSTTIVGPRPSCLEANASFVAVGTSTAGPTPQMNGSDLFGEKIKTLQSVTNAGLTLARSGYISLVNE